MSSTTEIPNPPPALSGGGNGSDSRRGRKKKESRPTRPVDETRRVIKHMYIKYAKNKQGEYVYILKTDCRKADVFFKIHIEHIRGVISWMETLLKHMESLPESKYWHYSGSVTDPDKLKSLHCSFDGDHLKVGTLHMRPCLPSWRNLWFRIWEETDDESQNVFKTDRNPEHQINREYATRLGIRQFKGLLRSIREISALIYPNV